MKNISRNVFYPKPNVDSVIIEFTPKNEKYNVKNERLFFEIIRTSFTQRRKTIKNNLNKYNLDIIEQVLKKHNYDLSVRAEQLNIDIFVEIANSLSE